jgi:crotonobetainyl-CoA:carnitine CoA-transferase CaiB-like acyl-CoA transferase
MSSEFKVPSSKFNVSTLNFELGTLNSELPLAGVRVVDFTVVWAGPYATMFLGDLGAEVIRVESLQHYPPSTRGMFARPTREMIARLGGISRAYFGLEPGERPWDRHAMFNSHARNKLSVTADMGSEEGRALFRRLVAISDVVVENNSASVMDRLGLSYDLLAKVRPDLILITMPTYGQTGPYRLYQGFGTNAEAVAGFTLLRGYADEGPENTSATLYMDAASGAGAAGALLAALWHRRRTGKGQLIDFSQMENMLPHLGEALMDRALNGRTRRTLGNRSEHAAPQGAYACAGEDSWVALSVQTEPQWQALCRLIGRAEWAADRRYATLPARWRRHAEIDTAIAAWTCRQAPHEAATRLQAAGIAAGMVTDNVSAYTDPHIRARDFFVPITHRETGTHQYPGFVFRYSDTPLTVRHPPCRLGEDNDHVYRELLGYPEAEIERLRALNHIGEVYVGV